VSRAAPERRCLRLKSHGKLRRLKSLRAATSATLQCPSFAMRPQPQVAFHYLEAHPRRSGDPARPTIVRRGRPCCLARRRGRVGCRAPAVIDARRTGARTGRAPVHSAQPADHFSCIAVRPRLAPRRPSFAGSVQSPGTTLRASGPSQSFAQTLPSFGGRAFYYQNHYRMEQGGVKEHTRRTGHRAGAALTPNPSP